MAKKKIFSIEERVGYIYSSIDIYPITLDEQIKLKKIFELLGINISPKLIGHTKIFIATKELNKNKISKLMEEDFRTDVENRCCTCNEKLPKNHPPMEADCKKCRDERI